MIRSGRFGDAQAIARVHADTWRRTYAAIVADEHLASLDYGSSAEMWRRILVLPEGKTRLFGVGSCVVSPFGRCSAVRWGASPVQN